MSKTYKIKVNQGAEAAKFVDIPQVGNTGKALAVKAVPGGKYQLMDASTGFAPENIRATRSGKDLQVFFEGRGQADLVIEDYYEVTPEGFNGLIGEAESGRYYEYIPESAVGNTAVPLLADGSTQVGMALGGAEINASGAAVGALVAAAGLNPLLLAPLALLGAAAGGGGSSGASGSATLDTTPPVIKSAKLHVDDDTGVKDNVTSDKTPRISGETEANADVSVEVNGKTYTGKADANGVFVIEVPVAGALKDGIYTPKVTATDAAKNKSVVFDGTPFKIDTSSDKNEPGPDLNTSAKIKIVSIDDDSGQNKTDFYTNDNQLLFNGTLEKFTQNGDWVKLELKDASGKVIDTAYVKPEPNGIDWRWDRTDKEKLADGQYSLIAVVVDGADNVVGLDSSSVSAEQAITIDTRGPVDPTDPNAGFILENIKILRDGDTGKSNSDFITKAGGTNSDLISFGGVLSGKLGTFNASLGESLGGSVWVQLISKKTGQATTEGIGTLTGNSWEFNTKATLLEGDYLVRATLLDQAGNRVSSSDQLLVIDRSISPIVPRDEKSTDINGILTVTDFYVGANEMGGYSFGAINDRPYVGGYFDLTELQNKGASINVPIMFADVAGNSTFVQGGSGDRPFASNATLTRAADANHPANLPSPGHSAQHPTTVGAVGAKLEITGNTEFDMSALYDGIAAIADRAAVNHVDLLTDKSVQTLNISVQDVLALGIGESFLSTGTNAGKIQMRIDGDDNDTVNLLNADGAVDAARWSVNKDTTVSLDGVVGFYYQATNITSGLDVFIKTGVDINIV